MPWSLGFSKFSLILKNCKILPIQFHFIVPKSILASFIALIPNAHIQPLNLWHRFHHQGLLCPLLLALLSPYWKTSVNPVPNAHVCVSFCHRYTIGKGKFKNDKKNAWENFFKSRSKKQRNKIPKSQNPTIGNSCFYWVCTQLQHHPCCLKWNLGVEQKQEINKRMRSKRYALTCYKLEPTINSDGHH